jgi:hypothetical protein
MTKDTPRMADIEPIMNPNYLKALHNARVQKQRKNRIPRLMPWVEIKSKQTVKDIADAIRISIAKLLPVLDEVCAEHPEMYINWSLERARLADEIEKKFETRAGAIAWIDRFLFC